jgi:hypothetical protein
MIPDARAAVMSQAALSMNQAGRRKVIGIGIAHFRQGDFAAHIGQLRPLAGIPDDSPHLPARGQQFGSDHAANVSGTTRDGKHLNLLEANGQRRDGDQCVAGTFTTQSYEYHLIPELLTYPPVLMSGSASSVGRS